MNNNEKDELWALKIYSENKFNIIKISTDKVH